MLGEKLKKLRKEKNLTQQQLGEILGISPSTVGMYEQERRKPDNDIIRKYCKHFGVSADYLLCENGDEGVEIDDVIAKIRSTLLAQNGLMFNGKPLTSEELLKIADTVELSIKVLALDKK